MKNGIWTMVAVSALGVALIGGPAMAQGRGRGAGNGQCNGTGQRIQKQLRDGSGLGRQGMGRGNGLRDGSGLGRRGQGQARGNGLGLRDGSGPNPNCPLKQK